MQGAAVVSCCIQAAHRLVIVQITLDRWTEPEYSTRLTRTNFTPSSYRSRGTREGQQTGCYLSIKEPLLYQAEHTIVTRGCPLSYLSSSADGDVGFFVVVPALLTRGGCLGMPGRGEQQKLGQ